MGGFQAAFEKDGGCVVNKLWPPLVTPDYTPYIAQIADCDVVCQGFAGSNPLRFMKQYASAGLKYPVVTGETGGDDALLKSYGEEAIGLVSCCPYTLDLPIDANQRFIDGMLKNYDTVPGQYAGLLYVNCQVVEAALKAGADAKDKEKFMAALERSVSPTRRAGRSSSTISATSSATSTSARLAPRAPNTGSRSGTKPSRPRERQPVLDLAGAGVSRAPGLFARLSATDQVLITHP